MEKLNYIDWKKAESTRVRKKAWKVKKAIDLASAKSPVIKAELNQLDKKTKEPKKTLKNPKEYPPHRILNRVTKTLKHVAKLEAKLHKQALKQSIVDKAKHKASLIAFKETYVRTTNDTTIKQLQVLQSVNCKKQRIKKIQNSKQVANPIFIKNAATQRQEKKKLRNTKIEIFVVNYYKEKNIPFRNNMEYKVAA